MTCSACDGRGWLVDIKTRVARRCDCSKTMLLLHDVPERYRHCSFQAWNGRVPVVLEKLAQHDPPAGRLWSDGSPMVLLWGKVETGKTHLATATLLAYRARGGDAVWLDALDGAQRLRDEVSDGVSELRGRASSCGMLVLDEFGRQRETPFITEAYEAILRCRHARSLRTVVTSNVGPADLAKANASLVRRITEGGSIHLRRTA